MTQAELDELELLSLERERANFLSPNNSSTNTKSFIGKTSSLFNDVTSPINKLSTPSGNYSNPAEAAVNVMRLASPLPDQMTPLGIVASPLSRYRGIENIANKIDIAGNEGVNSLVGNGVSAAASLSPKLPVGLRTPYENSVAGLGALAAGYAGGQGISPSTVAQDIGAQAFLEFAGIPAYEGVINLFGKTLPNELANAALPGVGNTNVERTIRNMPSVGGEALAEPRVGNKAKEIVENSQKLLKQTEKEVQMEAKTFKNTLPGKVNTGGVEIKGTPQLEYNPVSQEPVTPYQSNKEALIQDEMARRTPGSTIRLKAAPGYTYAEPSVGTIGSGVPEQTGLQTQGKLFTKGSSKGVFEPANTIEEQAIRQRNIDEQAKIMRDMANNVKDHSQPALDQILSAGTQMGEKIGSVKPGAEDAANSIVNHIKDKWSGKLNMEGLLKLRRQLDNVTSPGTFKSNITHTQAEVTTMETYNAMADRARQMISELSPKMADLMRREKTLIDIQRSAATQVGESIFRGGFLQIPMNVLRKSLFPARLLKGIGDQLSVEGAHPIIKTIGAEGLSTLGDVTNLYNTPYNKKDQNAP